jgi:aspartyl aminopeptidase
MTKTADPTSARELCRFIDAAPTPFHAVEEAGRRLLAAGFRRLDELAAWKLDPGGFFAVRGGSLLAWRVAPRTPPERGFRILGALTDSPNLRVKPRPDTGRAGIRQLGVEIYGGVLLNSWLDRDLGLSGRAYVRGELGPEARLFRIDRPLLRVPQLAIHLNREIDTEGLKLNKQTHMSPVWGLKGQGERGFRAFLAGELGARADDVLSWDAMCHDVCPSTPAGVEEEFVSAPRLDNLCSCFCALEALLALPAGDAPRHTPVVTLFDHVEVGSGSARGAASPILGDVLERIVLARGGSREDYHRAIADSACISADMAHGTHPNYVEKHEPDHHLLLNKGPVIKINTNLRYASEGETEALFQSACEAADVPYQKWVNRTDLACGSTIGPITAARLGVRTVDVGCPQLAMHSIRELCGSADPGFMARAMASFMLDAR